MSNIEYSKTAREILRNRPLANEMTKRMANLTPEECYNGKFHMPLVDGRTLVFRFGSSPPSEIKAENQTEPAKKNFFSRLGL